MNITAHKIATQKVSTCFDNSQNIYIFYEDLKARDGALEKNNRKNDGTHTAVAFWAWFPQLM
jgi:sulfur transfer complex TusBCD TusB component (DsrH family)